MMITPLLSSPWVSFTSFISQLAQAQAVPSPQFSIMQCWLGPSDGDGIVPVGPIRIEREPLRRRWDHCLLRIAKFDIPSSLGLSGLD